MLFSVVKTCFHLVDILMDSSPSIRSVGGRLHSTGPPGLDHNPEVPTSGRPNFFPKDGFSHIRSFLSQLYPRYLGFTFAQWEQLPARCPPRLQSMVWTQRWLKTKIHILKHQEWYRQYQATGELSSLNNSLSHLTVMDSDIDSHWQGLLQLKVVLLKPVFLESASCCCTS